MNEAQNAMKALNKQGFFWIAKWKNFEDKKKVVAAAQLQGVRSPH